MCYLSILRSCLTIIILASTYILAAQQTGPVQIDPVLLQAFSTKDHPDALILLRDQADVRLAARLRGKAAKGAFVFQQLQQKALQTQSGLITELQRKNLPHHPLFIVNAIYLPGLSRADLEWIARRPEVAAVLANSALPVASVREEPEVSLRQNAEWGVAKIQAPAVWAMGYTGQGAVIGGQDTGYDWAHPNILRQYRGWVKDSLAEHRYNWYDAIQSISPLNRDSLNPCGLRSAIPCDDNLHGTHTMGTMVGDDGQGNRTGVAPGAQWIGCRNMERGYGSPFTYLECFQWFLAPTDLDGSKPNPALAPDVINNSWYCPEMEGCNPSNFALLEKAVDHLRAAGVFVAVSAGNSGPNCQTISNLPAFFPGSFAVGATQANDTIARFSSRGPASYNGQVLMKPDVTAPGVGVRSAIPGGNYMALSGTSMAGPHVAGVVALMISANPALRGEVALLEDILRKTAVPIISPDQCGNFPGDSIPNPTYGHGRVDALAAVQAAIRQVTQKSDLISKSGLLVFPNPAWEEITLQLPNTAPAAPFVLYDLSGRQVFAQQIPSDTGTLHTIALPRLPDGMYVYRWQEYRGKLMLQH